MGVAEREGGRCGAAERESCVVKLEKEWCGMAKRESSVVGVPLFWER